MNVPLRPLAAVLSLTLLLNLCPTAAVAQTPQSQQTTPTPLPSQIAAAHAVFLVNDGADANFPLTEGQSYDQVYAALQAWGRFKLVGTAAGADLIFNLHGIAPITDISGSHGSTYSITSPAFQLTITDPATSTNLWTITSPVTIVGKGDKRARWDNIAVTNLISRIKVLVDQPLSATESADLTTVPKTHGVLAAVVIVGGIAGVAAVSTILIHNAYENSLARQKQQQDNFCVANNIPLSECAGG